MQACRRNLFGPQLCQVEDHGDRRLSGNMQPAFDPETWLDCQARCSLDELPMSSAPAEPSGSASVAQGCVSLFAAVLLREEMSPQAIEATERCCSHRKAIPTWNELAR